MPDLQGDAKVIDAYLKHAEERSALGVPPKPLDLEAVASAIEGPEASRGADTTSEVED